jgi:hypothetical protein
MENTTDITSTYFCYTEITTDGKIRIVEFAGNTTGCTSTYILR